MKRIETPGAWYGDTLPNERYVTTYPDGRVETSEGPRTVPNGLLYARIGPTPHFIGVVGSGPQGDHALEWTGVAPFADHGLVCGTSPAAYDPLTGGIVLSHCEPPYGSQGIRWVDVSAISPQSGNRVWTGDATYVDPAWPVWEATTHGNVKIGQGGDSDYGEDAAIICYAGKRYLLESGTCRFIRFSREGDQLAVSFFKMAALGNRLRTIRQILTSSYPEQLDYFKSAPPSNVRIYLTVAEITALPLFTPDPEEPMKVPVVTVANWTLDDVLEGREFRFSDTNNPELGYAARVWVQGGSMYAAITNAAGSAQTGAQRLVKPCSQGEDPDPEPPLVGMRPVSFGPNLGSVDFCTLFTESEQWNGYTGLAAFHFYGQNVLPIMQELVGPNTYENLKAAQAFSKVTGWGLSTEMELAGPPSQAYEAETKIAAAGGRLDVLAYDATFNEISVADFAAWVKEYRQTRPQWIILCYAAFPMVSADQIIARVRAWMALGAKPDVLRMDIDPGLRSRYTAADHAKLRAFCDAEHLGLQYVVNARDGLTSVEYNRQAWEWHESAEALGKWDGRIVQSWAAASDGSRQIPQNLRQGELAAFTTLLLRVLKAHKPIKPPEPEPEPLTKFTLQRHDSGHFINVGSDKFLLQTPAAATFEEVKLPNGKLGLKANGYFVAAESDHRCKADRVEAGDWEYWDKTIVSDKPLMVAYRSWQGLYLSCHDDGTVAADQRNIGGWETLVVGKITGGRPPITGPLTASTEEFFRNAHGHPTRYQGLTAFPLHRRFADGVNIQPFLDAFPKYNVLRLFAYVTWPNVGWEMPSVDQFLAFLQYVGDQGWYVELTLLTDDDPARLQPAKDLVRALAAARPNNLLLEIGNEPRTHKTIDTRALKSTCDASGFLYSSGNYEDPKDWFGSYGTAHTPRDWQWSRKAHELMEYHNGGGPGYPESPACPAPWVGDEPIRPDQCDPGWWNIVQDYRAYGGVAAILGGGCLFHFAQGRFGDLPGPLEQQCAAAMIEGLTAFPADVPGGSYRTIDEDPYSDIETGARTYIVGERAMVRVRPKTVACPEPGWTSLDADGILWTRAA